MKLRGCPLGVRGLALVLGIAGIPVSGALASPVTPVPAKANYGKLPLRFEPNRGQVKSPAEFIARGDGYQFALNGGNAVFVLQKLSKKSAKSVSEKPAVLKLDLIGARPQPKAQGEARLPGHVSYFRGRDPKHWCTNLPTFAKVRYNAVYPGIDLVYYGNQRQLEYDFLLSSGADPHKIAFQVSGADRIRINAAGELAIHTSAGQVVQHRPVIYQEIGGVRQAVRGGYVLKGRNRVGFKVDPYDVRKPLVIDPVLSYSTFFGGSYYEQGNAIAVDAQGNAYVTGTTQSLDFPVLPYENRPEGTYGKNEAAFIFKLNPAGTQVLYAGYLDGGANDEGRAVAVDAEGNAYVAGYTESEYDPGNAPLGLPSTVGFPTTETAFKPVSGNSDPFLSKISADGNTLLYSTTIGSGGIDGANAVAVDNDGHAWVAGYTKSYLDPTYPSRFQDFQTTEGAFQRQYGGEDNGLYGPGQFGDAFISEFDTNASGDASLAASTYLGGNGDDVINAIALDPQGNVVVAGRTVSNNFPLTAGAYQKQYLGGGFFLYGDGFIARLNPNLTALLNSTYIGGGEADELTAVALDRQGNVLVTGFTYSSELDRLYPVTQGAFEDYKTNDRCTYQKMKDAGIDQNGNRLVTSEDFQLLCEDAVVTKFLPDLSSLVYSTYLGGDIIDSADSLAVDEAGNAYVGGRSNSTNFLVTGNTPILLTYGSGMPDGGRGGFLAKLDPQGQPLFITQTGAPVSGLAIDAAHNVYLTGQIFSWGYPVTPGAAQPTFGGNSDVYVSKVAADLGLPTPKASEQFQFDASLGSVRMNGVDILFMYVNAFPATSDMPSQQPDFSILGPGGKAVAQSNLLFFAGKGLHELLGQGKAATPGDYRLQFSFSDAGLVKDVTLGPNPGALAAPQDNVSAPNDGSLQLWWDAVPGAKSYFTWIYGKPNGSDAFQLTALGPSTRPGIDFPAGQLAAGVTYTAITIATDLDITAKPLASAFNGVAGGSDDFQVGTQTGTPPAPPSYDPPAYGTGTPPDDGPPAIAGDVNGDGKVNIQDATLVLQIAVGTVNPTPQQLKAADLNGDGKVNIQDATTLLRKAVGLG